MMVGIRFFVMTMAISVRLPLLWSLLLKGSRCNANPRDSVVGRTFRMVRSCEMDAWWVFWVVSGSTSEQEIASGQLTAHCGILFFLIERILGDRRYMEVVVLLSTRFSCRCLGHRTTAGSLGGRTMTRPHGIYKVSYPMGSTHRHSRNSIHVDHEAHFSNTRVIPLRLSRFLCARELKSNIAKCIRFTMQNATSD